MAKGGGLFDGPGSQDRPNHADFWKLAEIVLHVDGQVKEGGREVTAILGEAIDPDSLEYVAMQRAMKVLGVRTRGQMAEKFGPIAGLASMYLEGFIVGFRYCERRPKEEVS